MTGPEKSSIVNSACHQMMRLRMAASLARTSITLALNDGSHA